MELCLHQSAAGRRRCRSRSGSVRAKRPRPSTGSRTRCGHDADPELFMPDTLENIQSYLEHDLCLGAWDGERLGPTLSCGTAGTVSTTTLRSWAFRRPSGSIGPMPTASSSTRTGGAMACSASCWKTRCPLLRPGIVGIGATVSPGNPYSLNNAKASGFEIVSRREMYGGHDRYLLAKHL